LLYFVIISVFAIFRYTSHLRLFKDNLLFSHDVARTETRSHFVPMTGIIY